MATPSGQGEQQQPDELTSLKASLEDARAALHIAEAATQAISELTLAAREAMSEGEADGCGHERSKAFAAIAAICGQARQIVAVEANAEAGVGSQATGAPAENLTASFSCGVTQSGPHQEVPDSAASEVAQSTVLLQSLQSTIDGYLARLQAQVKNFGQNLPELHARLTFAQKLGSDNADSGQPVLNDEGAGLLALKTRHQLTSVRLSLASHAEWSVLRNF